MIETQAFILHHSLLPEHSAQDGVAVKDRAFARPAFAGAQRPLMSHVKAPATPQAPLSFGRVGEFRLDVRWRGRGREQELSRRLIKLSFADLNRKTMAVLLGKADPLFTRAWPLGLPPRTRRVFLPVIAGPAPRLIRAPVPGAGDGLLALSRRARQPRGQRPRRSLPVRGQSRPPRPAASCGQRSSR